MKLSDVFTDAEQLHTVMHSDEDIETAKRNAAKRFDELLPLWTCFRECIERCGQTIPEIGLDEELALMMSTAMLIDAALEKLTSNKKVS
jgi:hypothetical protein